MFNLGVSGDTAEGLLARLEPELVPRQLGDQTIVVLAVGVNETAFDLRTGRPTHDPERFAGTLAEVVRGQAPLRPGGAGRAAPLRRGEDAAAAVEPGRGREPRQRPHPRVQPGRGRVAADSGVTLVDCFEEVLAGDHAALLHDGLHPNGAGHQLLADRIGERLARWL